MKQKLWRRAEELFHAALERSPDGRQAFLDEACGEDTDLRRLVETLVSKDEQASRFLEGAVLADVPTALGAVESWVGRQYGSYRILSFLGAGGMGRVYRAHDEKLGRDVAIKTLPAEFARDPERLARFRREARTLASLNHPNLAAICTAHCTGQRARLRLPGGRGFSGVSVDTVKRDWRMARAWLLAELTAVTGADVAGRT